jgi:SSS family solute:Na+ symporter
MVLTLDTVDFIIVIISLLATALAGYMARTRGEGYDSIAIAGRSLTMPMFVVTLVATWYGAVLGVGEFVWSYGIVVILCFGLPYYLAAILYAFLVAPRIRQAASTTIPQRITDVYGIWPGRIATGLIIIVTSPAPYVLMAGELVHAITGWGTTWSMMAITALSIGYVVKGGLRSDVYANTVQIVLMYAGFGLLLWFAIDRFGDVASLTQQLPSSTFEIPGSLGWTGIAAWWMIALQTFIDPNFHQRVAATSHPSVARRGLLVSVGCWIVFDTLTVLTSLYALAHVDIIRPIDTHLVLAQAILPPIAKGIFVGGIFAAVLSTLDGYALVQGMTLGRDLFDAVRGKPASVVSFRVGVVVAGILSILMAVALPSIIGLFMTLAGYTLPGLLLPLLASYTSYATRLQGGSVLRMLVPTVVVVLLHATTSAELPLAVVAGLGTSVVIHAAHVLYPRRSHAA